MSTWLGKWMRDTLGDHTFTGDYQDEQYRVLRCGHREDYRICFPRNGQYEIDKIRGFYVRAGVDLTEYSAIFDPVETVDVSDKSKRHEAKEEVGMEEHYRDILQLLSCGRGLGPIQEFGRVNRLDVAVSDMIGEDTYERDEEREAIVRELSDEAADDDHDGQASVLRLHTSTALIDGKVIISMHAKFEVLNKKKTIGILLRSDLNDTSALPPIAAMSGWTHKPNSDLNVQIPGRKWTDEVFYLCQIIGHGLPESENDQGRPGQYYACHAEKQLIAYLVSRHVFLPRDIEDEDEDEDFGLAKLSLSEFQGDQSPRQRVRELKNIEPLQRLKDATILVTRTVCDDCRVFAERVNETLGLNIQMRGPSSCT
ncbi:hypothetical protein ACSS6W_003636 [Trichoderma asperelloides]